MGPLKYGASPGFYTRTAGSIPGGSIFWSSCIVGLMHSPYKRAYRYSGIVGSTSQPKLKKMSETVRRVMFLDPRVFASNVS